MQSIKIAIVCITFAVAATNCHPIGRNQTNHQDDDFGMYYMFGGGNPVKTPDGRSIIEGDIVVPPTKGYGSLIREISLQSNRSSRKATADQSVYWPNGEVIYTYHESITPSEMTVIEAAMQHWQKHTCIKFRPRQANDYYFVRFRSDTQGCWSLVGRQVERAGAGQDVSIGTGCANLNVVVHEIGHVLGFYHEQSRSDRDQYIHIVWNNVLGGYALQFRKENDISYDIPYDLTSTMQYPQWAFSKQLFEKSTIVALNPAYQRFLSKNYPLSFRDRRLANHLYGCSASCGSSSANSCSNGGYARTSTLASTTIGGGQCSCDCPPNYSGGQCENMIRSDYYENLPCGGNIDKSGVIETPNYPQRTAPLQSCMWDITAPSPNQKVYIKFEGFEFAPRFTKAGTKVINKCFNETVEIRLRNADIYNGDIYCGTDIAPGTVLSSDGPRATIIITANDKMIGAGLRAKVSFRDGSNDDDEDAEDNQEKVTTEGQDDKETGQTTPFVQGTSTPMPPIIPFTAPPGFTFQPITSGPINTFPPFIVSPQPPSPSPPPPPSVVTTNSLWEEYEKESKKTLPPLIPY